MKLNPHSVLDIGPGFGKYGLLCREYLEMWGEENLHAQYGKHTRRIDCIEIFDAYITPVHYNIYDNIYIGDAYECVRHKGFFHYDLVLMIDVLEHFEKSRGLSLASKLLAKTNGIIISTPKNFFAQGEGFHNIYETHKSHWSAKEFEALASRCDWIEDDLSLICYLSFA